MSCLSIQRDIWNRSQKQSTILQDGRTNRKKIHKIEREFLVLPISLTFLYFFLSYFEISLGECKFE